MIRKRQDDRVARHLSVANTAAHPIMSIPRMAPVVKTTSKAINPNQGRTCHETSAVADLCQWFQMSARLGDRARWQFGDRRLFARARARRERMDLAMGLVVQGEICGLGRQVQQLGLARLRPRWRYAPRQTQPYPLFHLFDGLRALAHTHTPGRRLHCGWGNSATPALETSHLSSEYEV